MNSRLSQIRLHDIQQLQKLISGNNQSQGNTRRKKHKEVKKVRGKQQTWKTGKERAIVKLSKSLKE